MSALVLVLALAVQVEPSEPVPPSPDQIQTWYEAGQDEQIIQAVQDHPDPRAVYLAGLAYVRLEQPDSARQRFENLGARDDSDAWAHIGRSAARLNTPAINEEGAVTAESEMAAWGEAEQAARRAIEIDPMLGVAHYQLGLVHGRQKDYAAAAAAFDAAVAVDPSFAYAHYYGGLSHYQNKQTVQMAIAFEHFLTVAPDAPERGQVESIMRTLRGR